ncbi:unnamed protein product [Agarophyton chilense]
MLFRNLKIYDKFPVNYQLWDEPVHYDWYSRQERCGSKALKTMMNVNGSEVGDLGMRHRLMTSDRFAEVVYDKKLSLYEGVKRSIIGKTFVIKQGADESSYSCATIYASRLHSQRPGAIPCEIKQYSDCVVGTAEDGMCTLKSCYGYRQYWGVIDEKTEMCAQIRDMYPKRLERSGETNGVFSCKMLSHHSQTTNTIAFAPPLSSLNVSSKPNNCSPSQPSSCSRHNRVLWRMASTAPPSASYPPSPHSSVASFSKQDDSSSMFSADMSFEQLGLAESTIQALKRCGIQTPTRVQSTVIPLLLQGLSLQVRYAAKVKEAYEAAELELSADFNQNTLNDFSRRPKPAEDDVNDVLMVGAETGSGKTLAYLLPYIEALRTSPIDLKAIILVPSRELCWQTLKFLTSYFEDVPRYLVLAGGTPPDVSDVKAVKMIIATPSALLNYFRFSQKADVSDKMIIVDEADMLLSGGFLADVERILDQPGMKPFATRRNKSVRDMNRNRLVFIGATYPHWTGEKVRSIVTWMKRRYPDIKAVQTENIHKHSDKLSSRWIFEPNEEKRLELLLDVLRNEATPADKIMVFASAADTAQRIARLVEDQYGKDELEAKFGCALQLHKLVRAGDRAESLDKFRCGEGRLLFCTDLGSRGLDLGNVTRVIEFEFASNVVAYLHRIGRTARAGATGSTDHYYGEMARPLAETIKGRADLATTVVDGVFSRNRSFRKKLKQRQRKPQTEAAHGRGDDVVAQSLKTVEIDAPDEEERKRFDGHD